eukprot:UN08414
MSTEDHFTIEIQLMNLSEKDNSSLASDTGTSVSVELSTDINQNIYFSTGRKMRNENNLIQIECEYKGNGIFAVEGQGPFQDETVSIVFIVNSLTYKGVTNNNET